MKDYGAVKTHTAQLNMIKKQLKTMGVFFIIVAFLGWVVQFFWLDVSFPLWGYVGVCSLIYLVSAFNTSKVLKKIDDKKIGLLLSEGKENQAFLNTIDKAYKINGSINVFDLKGIQYEIWLHNEALKSELNNPNSQKSAESLIGWGEYEYNKNLIESISKILKK